MIQSVDLFVSPAPVTFNQEGRPQLAYELHVTNFLAVEVSLATVQVRAADGRMLAEHRDSDLQSRIVRPGLRNDHATPHVVGPGMRAIVNLWIALPAGAPTPASLERPAPIAVLRFPER